MPPVEREGINHEGRFAPDTKITKELIGLRVLRACRKAFVVSTLK